MSTERSDGIRPTRWQKAKADRPGFTRLRESVVLSAIGLGISAVALLLAGFPHDAAVTAATLAGSAIALAILVPAAQLYWSWLQAPMRLLSEDVAQVRALLERAPRESPSPNVRIELLNLARKGRALEGAHGVSSRGLNAWSDEVATFCQRHLDPVDAELFLNAGNALFVKLEVLGRLADKY